MDRMSSDSGGEKGRWKDVHRGKPQLCFFFPSLSPNLQKAEAEKEYCMFECQVHSQVVPFAKFQTGQRIKIQVCNESRKHKKKKTEWKRQRKGGKLTLSY